MEPDELIQLHERAVLEAEQAYRVNPSDATQRRVMTAWNELRRARGEAADAAYPLPTSRPGNDPG